MIGLDPIIDELEAAGWFLHPDGRIDRRQSIALVSFRDALIGALVSAVTKRWMLRTALAREKTRPISYGVQERPTTPGIPPCWTCNGLGHVMHGGVIPSECLRCEGKGYR